MGRGFILTISITAIVIAVVDLYYTLKVKKSIMHTLEKIELEQKRSLFNSIGMDKPVSESNPQSAVALAKAVKQALLERLKLSGSLTYPQLLEELDKRGFPSDVRDELSELFNAVMRLEYSNNKDVDTEKMNKLASDIIKKLGLNLNAKA